MEVAGPLGTPLGLAQRKRASPRGEAHSPPPGRKIEKKTQGGQLSPGKGPPSPGGPQTPPVQALEGNSSAHVSPSAALGLLNRFFRPHVIAQSLPTAQGKPKNIGVGSLSLLQGIFPTQELNWGLLHCKQILYQLMPPGKRMLRASTATAAATALAGGSWLSVGSSVSPSMGRPHFLPM